MPQAESAIATSEFQDLQEDELRCVDPAPHAANAKLLRVQGKNSKLAIAVLALFVGGCVNFLCLEQLRSLDPHVSYLLTFIGFIFVVLEGFWSQCIQLFPLVMKSRRIPMRWYIMFGAITFCSSFCANKTLDLGMPMPLHLLFKSGNLVTNIILGSTLFGKRYSSYQYISVLLVTSGIVMATVASTPEDDLGSPASVWFKSVLLMVVGLSCSALFSLVQEQSYCKFGPVWQESMFYSHLFSLPTFLVFLPHVRAHSFTFWALLAASVLSMYFSTWGYYKLCVMADSLSTTLLITLRKFLSLLLSVYIFENSFTVSHWIGATLVIGGSLLYALFPLQKASRTSYSCSTMNEQTKRE